MKGFNPSFSQETARTYDNSPRGDEAETVAFLARFGKHALEFAVGTGRIALPLAAAGVTVDGIELSPDMVARLREKPGGDQLDVTMGDMSRAGTGRAYSLVYLVYNTITNLLTQDDQVRCFDENHVTIRADGIRFGPIRQRLAYPSEFDLMARIAGLRLRDRWGGWNGEPFTAASTRHVSVYEAAA